MKAKIFDFDFFLLSFLYLISILPVAKYFGLLIQIFLFYKYFFGKKYENLAILLFSFCLYSHSISIYSFKLIYILVFSLFVISLPKILHLEFNSLNAHAVILLFLYFLIYSFCKNFYTHSVSFMGDCIILLGFFAGGLLFCNIRKDSLVYIASKLFALYVFTCIFSIFFNYGFSSDVDWWGRNKRILMLGESFPLFLYVLLFFLFFSTKKFIFRISLTIIYLIIAVKLQDFGSMVMIFFMLCIICLSFLKFWFSKHKGRNLVLVFSVFFALGTLVSFLNTTELSKKYEAISFKIENITKLFRNFSFSDKRKIVLIPLSPYVRVLEIINITASGNPYTIMFGEGAGGAYTDSYFPFENKSAGKILGPDDFPLEQRKSHIFTAAHNLGYPYLKYGLSWFFFFSLYILYSLKKSKKKSPSEFYLSFVFFLAITCYIGFTFQTSMAVALIFISFTKNTAERSS